MMLVENLEKGQKNNARPRLDVTVALSVAAFLIGGELLGVGGESAGDAYSSGIAFLIAIPFVFAATGAARAVFSNRDDRIFAKVVRVIFAILSAAAAVFVSIDTAMKFSSFAASVMLLRAPRLPVALLFLGFCGFLASKGGNTVRKFAFLTTLSVGVCAIVMILLSIPSLSLRGMDGAVGEPTVKHTVTAFARKFAPICVALVYFSIESRPRTTDGFGSRGAKYRPSRLTPITALVGVLIGGAILTVCHLNVTLLPALADLTV